MWCHQQKRDRPQQIELLLHGHAPQQRKSGRRMVEHRVVVIGCEGDAGQRVSPRNRGSQQQLPDNGDGDAHIDGREHADRAASVKRFQIDRSSRLLFAVQQNRKQESAEHQEECHAVHEEREDPGVTKNHKQNRNPLSDGS